MNILAGALGTLVILSGAAFIFLYTGWYDVAATTPHWEITSWILSEARDRSIAYHSRGIQAPSLKDSKMVKTGFEEYHAMCRLCHGAPGYAPTEISRGLNPKPPDLGSEDAQSLRAGEVYWTVRNGIKMTGMPGFGPTHDENELWAIVGFVKRIPAIQAKEYEAMARDAERGKEKGGHRHDSKKY